MRLTLILCLVPLTCLAQDIKPPSVKVTVDTTEVPELADWGATAKTLVETWYPKIVKLLKTEGYQPPDEITLLFKKEMKGVAFASGKTITISGDWVKAHPEDLGMVVHELTHVIQAYPGNRGAGWLVEGIADNIRFIHFEPQTKITIRNPEKASYRDSYRTAAKFLDWIEKKYDPQLISKLNAALRSRSYTPKVFKERTTKTLDELWTEFVETLLS